MAYIRSNVWELGSDWAEPIYWYARGVAAMRARPLADPTSWSFFAAMHGINRRLWEVLGYLDATEAMPAENVTDIYWEQCQHGSWYFLPWHRGYILAIEAILRAAVVDQGGPDDWALPYWNYFKEGQDVLPRAFASPEWPDGDNNPLFVLQRYGPNNDGNVFVPLSGGVNLKAMKEDVFTGVASGGGTGFGGVDTGFAHGGQIHGGIEAEPHDWVHGLVGGEDPTPPNHYPGLMSYPKSAALDPIFWLHHANIDRLWEVWRRTPQGVHSDPVDPNWVQGPANIGERLFAAPMPDGTKWIYTPGEMSDLARLDYSYDDLTLAGDAPVDTDRLARLGLLSAATDNMEGEPAMPSPRNVELLAANQESVNIQGSEARSSVQFDRPALMGTTASLTMASPPPADGSTTSEPPSPDRVFLNLENVTGRSDATAFQVYVGLPDGANPIEHPERLAGSVALFGVRDASDPDGEHGGQGLTYVLEITDIMDDLHLNDALNVDTLDVRIVPVTPVPESAQVTIGRISVFRQGL